MQIDTKNRDGSMAEPGMPFSPGIYPKNQRVRTIIIYLCRYLCLCFCLCL
jgi:hypothetical protein